MRSLCLKFQQKRSKFFIGYYKYCPCKSRYSEALGINCFFFFCSRQQKREQHARKSISQPLNGKYSRTRFRLKPAWALNFSHCKHCLKSVNGFLTIPIKDSADVNFNLQYITEIMYPLKNK